MAGSAFRPVFAAERLPLEARNIPPAHCSIDRIVAGEDDARAVFRRLEDAIGRGDVSAISQYFSTKVYLNLFSGETGLYSAEQSFVILKNFFGQHVALSFRFSGTNTDAESPYGVGTLAFMKRGQRSAAQVYVALSKRGGDWKIAQLTFAHR